MASDPDKRGLGAGPATRRLFGDWQGGQSTVAEDSAGQETPSEMVDLSTLKARIDNKIRPHIATLRERESAAGNHTFYLDMNEAAVTGLELAVDDALSQLKSIRQTSSMMSVDDIETIRGFVAFCESEEILTGNAEMPDEVLKAIRASASQTLVFHRLNERLKGKPDYGREELHLERRR